MTDLTRIILAELFSLLFKSGVRTSDRYYDFNDQISFYIWTTKPRLKIYLKIMNGKLVVSSHKRAGRRKDNDDTETLWMIDKRYFNISDPDLLEQIVKFLLWSLEQ